MKKESIHVRVLTATDLHQSKLHYRGLASAVDQHRPDALALVGDFLDMMAGRYHLDTAECAKFLADLPVEHLLCVRGNHEDSNWPTFVAAWPHEQRKLIALYGSAYTVGPLVIVGFPCLLGSEFDWCAHLSPDSNQMRQAPEKSRECLVAVAQTWLPKLMHALGPPGRSLWLAHECPIGPPLAHPGVFNSTWNGAVERFLPHVVISGHDHDAPLDSGQWQARLGRTLCVNVGQTDIDFHYTVLDFEFASCAPSLPSQIRIKAFPWLSEIVVDPKCPEHQPSNLPLPKET